MTVTTPPELPDLADRPVVDPEALIEEARQRARRRRRRNLVGMLAAALGALWLYSVISAGGSTEPSATIAQLPRTAGSLKPPLPEELSYTAGNGVWLIRPDGTRHRLVEGLYKRSPDGLLRLTRAISGVEWSPDGSKLLAFRSGSAPALVLVDDRGDVGAPVARRASQGSWSPDGTRIAFVRPERDAGHVIYVASSDGRHVKQVGTYGQYGQYGAGPSFSWSPDGHRLVYAGRWKSGLFVVDATGRGAPRSILPGARVASPRWSPDGLLIAFQSGGQVYVVRPDGTRPQQIADGQGIAWSPEGRLVAFLGTSRESYGAVSVVRPDGTGLRRVGRCACTLRGPGFWPSLSWSSDGSRLAFVSGRGNAVSTVSPDGLGATRVAIQPPRRYRGPWLPIWRPTSKR
jgi:Tol biopolymer transport system component